MVRSEALTPGAAVCKVIRWEPFVPNPKTPDGLPLLSVAVVPFPGVRPLDKAEVACRPPQHPMAGFSAWCPIEDHVILTAYAYTHEAVLDPAPMLCTIVINPSGHGL